MRHSHLALEAQHFFSLTNRTLATITQENLGLCSAVTHTHIRWTDGRRPAWCIHCRLKSEGFPH